MDNVAVEEYLIDYINIVQWDIMKLIEVAKAGEAVQLENLKQQRAQDADENRARFPYATPSATSSLLLAEAEIIKPLTSSSLSTEKMAARSTPTLIGSSLIQHSSSISYVRSSFVKQHTFSAAKCAAPLAMTLLSSSEFLGSLLTFNEAIWNAGDGKFIKAILPFFNYADYKVQSSDEIDVLRGIYRNGMMHGFLPQGVGIALDYQSRFDAEDQLFFIDRVNDAKDVTLNLNKLFKICSNVYKKIISDNSNRSAIGKVLIALNENINKSSEKPIRQLKNDILRNEIKKKD